jgi:hypothetical protein
MAAGGPGRAAAAAHAVPGGASPTSPGDGAGAAPDVKTRHRRWRSEGRT